MAIDIESEKVIPLGAAPRHTPGRPHLATVYRWATRDENPLETLKVGGRLFTSVEAIRRFIGRCTNPDEVPRPVTNEARQQTVEKELAAVGI